MSRIKTLLLLSIVTIFFFSSCFKNKNTPTLYSSWGIVVNPELNVPKFVFDWNFLKQSSANNLNNFKGIGTIPDSVRFFMYYSFVNPSVDSTLININNLSTILTKKLQFYNGITAVPDTFGTNPLNIDTYYNAPFFKQNYLTIPFGYYLSKAGITHMISLVYNANNSLWNNTLDTMKVEFRHNAKGDDGNFPSTNNWVAFNLNGLKPTGAPDSFKIRIVYISLSQSLGNIPDTIVVPAKWQ